MEGNWNELKGKVREEWGKLTQDDVDMVKGKMEQLAGRVQQRYSITKDQAESQVKEWLSKAKSSMDVAGNRSR